MRLILILLYFFFIFMRFQVISEVRKISYDESQVCEYFSSFVKQYGKTYSNNRTEYDKRLKIFTKRVEDINNRNKQICDIQFGISRFSDMTDCEIDDRFLRHEPLDSEDQAAEKLGAPPEIPCGDVPEEWDWSIYNAVTPPRFYKCSAAYSFINSLLGTMESLYAIKTDQLIYLSLQQIIDCVVDDFSCNGSTVDYNTIVQYVSTRGLADDSDYPFEGDQGMCDEDNKEPVVKMDMSTLSIQGYTSKINEEQLKAIVFNKGPLGMRIPMSTYFMEYSNGIGTSETLCKDDKNLHTYDVLLVGYGESDGVPYWKFKGYLGPDWGEDGYWRMLRGSNTCGILNSTTISFDIQLLDEH